MWGQEYWVHTCHTCHTKILRLYFITPTKYLVENCDMSYKNTGLIFVIFLLQEYWVDSCDMSHKNALLQMWYMSYKNILLIIVISVLHEFWVDSCDTPPTRISGWYLWHLLQEYCADSWYVLKNIGLIVETISSTLTLGWCLWYVPYKNILLIFVISAVQEYRMIYSYDNCPTRTLC
jgi:hypothetical protein